MNIIEAIKAVNWRDVVSRAIWTFLQVFLAAFLVAGESLLDLLFNGNWNTLVTLVVATTLSGVSAGLSAIKTIALETIRNIRDGAQLDQ